VAVAIFEVLVMSCGDCEQSSLAPGTGSSTGEVGRCTESCRSLRIVEAEWDCNSDDNHVRCGDDATMRAVVRGPGSRSGETVDFVVTHRHTSQQIHSAQDDTRRHRAEAIWIAQKQCDVWDNPEAFFTARAGGDSRNSSNLSFHRYPDFSEENVQLEGLDNPRIDLSFTEGEYILGVKIYLIPRSASRRNAHDTLTIEELAEINASVDPAEASPEHQQWAEDMQERIQAVFQDRWVLHRRNCQREDDCDCPVSYHCCKFPLKVQVQLLHYSDHEGDLNTVEVWNNLAHVANVWPNNGRDSTFDWYRGWSSADPCEEHQRGFRDDCEACQQLQAEGSENPCSRHMYHVARESCQACREIFRNRQALTLAHEVGHYLGFYDEYPQSEGGRTHPNAGLNEQVRWQTQASSNLMGLSADGGSVGEGIPSYYFEPFREFFSKRMDEEFDFIPAS